MTAKQMRELKILSPIIGSFMIAWGFLVVGDFFPGTGPGRSVAEILELPVWYGIKWRLIVVGILFLIGTAMFTDLFQMT